MIREILKVDSDKISISVPSKYMGKFLEVIAFSSDETTLKNDIQRKQPTFNAISLDTRGYKFNRDEADER